MAENKRVTGVVSKNNGTPKSSILIGVFIINHLFWGTPIFGNIQLYPLLFFGVISPYLVTYNDYLGAHLGESRSAFLSEGIFEGWWDAYSPEK